MRWKTAHQESRLQTIANKKFRLEQLTYFFFQWRNSFFLVLMQTNRLVDKIKKQTSILWSCIGSFFTLHKKRFASNEMFQKNASIFALFYVYLCIRKSTIFFSFFKNGTKWKTKKKNYRIYSCIESSKCYSIFYYKGQRIKVHFDYLHCGEKRFRTK